MIDHRDEDDDNELPPATLHDRDNAARVEYLMIKSQLVGLDRPTVPNFFQAQQRRFDMTGPYLVELIKSNPKSKKDLGTELEDLSRIHTVIGETYVKTVDVLANLGSALNLSIHTVESDERERGKRDNAHYGTIELFGRKKYTIEGQRAIRELLQKRIGKARDVIEDGLDFILENAFRMSYLCQVYGKKEIPTLNAIEASTSERWEDTRRRFLDLQKAIITGPFSYKP